MKKYLIMADPLITSALIGGGVSLFNNLFGSASAKSSQARQFEYQKQLNQQQFDLQKQMFDYTSEYNNASNQVQRLKDAGLNPNLAYGNGQVAGGTGQTGTISGGSVSAPTHSWNIDLSQAMALKKLGAETEYINEKKIAENLENIMRNAKSKYADEAAKLSVDLAKQSIIKMSNESQLIKEKVNTEIGIQYNLQADTMNKISQSVLNESQVAVNISQVKLNAKKIQDIDSNISYRKALEIQVSYNCEYLSSSTAVNDETSVGIRLKNFNDQKFLSRRSESELEEIAARTGKLIAETGKAKAETGKAKAETSESYQRTQSSRNQFGATNWTGLFNNVDNLLKQFGL